MRRPRDRDAAIRRIAVTSILAPILAGCLAGRGAIRTAPGCYEGPFDLRVVHEDGAPAGNTPIGIFFMLWMADPSTGNVELYEKTRRTNANGRFHRDAVRECMTPTYLYAMDEPHGLAALKVISDVDEIDAPHRLTLRPACRVSGRVSASHLNEPRRADPPILVALHPGTRLTSRYLKRQTIDGHFEFLVPPGAYTLAISTRDATSKGVRIDIPRNSKHLDIGVVAFEMKVVPPAGKSVRIQASGAH
ncbi:MAG: hypothetical protein KDA33_03175 [Phycisphaerales bacterium]|nr:hypothetical protein [Phycisphaerales bacterium]